VQLQEPFK